MKIKNNVIVGIGININSQKEDLEGYKKAIMDSIITTC